MKVGSKALRRLAVGSGLLLLAGIFAALARLLANIISQTYLPHRIGFLGNTHLLWLHVVSDAIIGISCFVIAWTLMRFMQASSREVPFETMFLALWVFILACGFTHLLAVVVFWEPLSGLEVDVKFLTAVASAFTALALPLSIPRIRDILTRSTRSAENERRFYAAANSSLDSIFILTSVRNAAGSIEDFTFDFVNPNAAQLLHRKPDQIVGHTLGNLSPFQRTSGLFDRYIRVAETGVGFREEFPIELEDVVARWLKIQAIKLDDGVLITTSDITNRKRLEYERTKAFTRSLINSSPATIIVTDLSYTITAINPAAERMLWYKPEELIEKQTPLIFYDFEEIEDRADKLSAKYGMQVTTNEVIFFVSRAQNIDDEAEWSFIRKGGSRLSVQVTVTPLVGDSAHDSGFMITAYDISERKRREEYIAHISQHDSLTGLPTRHLLFDRLEMAIARANRSESKCALLMLDLNEFKAINDSYGHAAGDILLVHLADQLRSAIRASDTVARMGGDEFFVLLEGLHGVAEAITIAKQIKESLARPFILSQGTTISVSASIGVCMYPESATDSASMTKNADIAMYHAKAVGGLQIEIYTQTLARNSMQKQKIAASLRDAIHNGELQLHYQPQLDLRDEHVAGFEGLLRWISPRLGTISPSVFIPIAEENGMIQPIGAWVLKQACKDIQSLNESLGRDHFISVNISPRQLEQKGFLEIVTEAVQESNINPKCLELEITEGVLMKDSIATTALLDGLRALGVRIAIDDFGTGFSNMSSLLRLPIDCLKIDRSIIDGCSTASNMSTVASAIIALAHQLNLSVVAEGAEVREEIEFLQQEKCDRVQGFYFSRALPLDQILALDLTGIGDGQKLRTAADAASFPDLATHQAPQSTVAPFPLRVS